MAGIRQAKSSAHCLDPAFNRPVNNRSIADVCIQSKQPQTSLIFHVAQGTMQEWKLFFYSVVMRQLIESQSWASGFLVVVAVSALLALFTGRLQITTSRRISCVLGPVAISYCLYWSPVWLGADSSEYSSWSVAFIAPWSAVGILVSAAIMIGLRQYLKTKRAKDA
jgi:hypothetical protein